MSEKTLKQKTISGLTWSAIDKIIQQLFVFVSGIILAKILDRESYGLIGVLTIFTGIANFLQDGGFTTALLSKKNATQDDYITVFYTNIVVSIFLYLILFFAAPLIGNFYNSPILVPLSRFVFLSFLFNSFSIIQDTKLQKEINYKLKTKINLISVFTSYSVALLIAFLGYGVWALASQLVVMTFIRCCCLWIFGKWKIGGSFSIQSFKEFFSYGSKLVLGGIMNAFTFNIPQNIIAKQYSLGIGGLFTQATRLYNTVFDFIVGSAQNVPFAVLANIEDQSRFKNAVRKFMRVKALIIFPLLFGLIFVAKTFISQFLGAEWVDSAPILQLLCIGGVFASLDLSNIDILKAKAKVGRIVTLEAFRNILIIIILVLNIIIKADYLYVIAGLSSAYVIKYILTTYITNRLINYKISELIKDLFPYLTVTIVSIMGGYSLKYIINNQILLLIAQVIFVGTSYFIILYFCGSVLVKEAFSLVIKKILKKSVDDSETKEP